ncbi:MAG TPA: ATP-binding protein [Streptosporangiaceae bacterium]|nr:ATP-binding protein [Streptosporangiaceae bacterium]
MTPQPLSLIASLEPAQTITHRLDGPRPEHLARRVVTDVMTELGLIADLPDVELVINELVTNARQHAPGPYELRIFIECTTVKIAVLDGGADHAGIEHKLARAAQGAPTDAESGRGLQIVTGMFPGAWGAEPTVTCAGRTPAKQVWITMPRPTPDSPGQAGDQDAENR